MIEAIAIESICRRINELHKYFGNDMYLCFHFLQLFALTKIVIDYWERGTEPTNFQGCMEEKYESLEDYV